MLNKKYLPSKNFLVALSIAIVIILIAIIINFWKSNTTKYKNNNLAVNTNASSSVMEIDSDNDGLPDWKEVLYGTNPKVTDTDKDKTNDADEIALNRDPLKANTASSGQEPNDKIADAIIEQNKKALEDYNKLTDTEKFSRNLISNIIATQPVSGSMNQSSIDSIVNTSLNEIPQKQYSGITKSADLNLLQTDNENLTKNLTDYAKNFYTETQKLIPILGTDISLMNEYVTNNSTSTRLKMLQLTAKYQNIVNNLIKMPVPVAIGYYDINYHLTVINDLEKIIAIDKDIVNPNGDSLGIFSSLSIYNGTFNNLITVLKTIDSILKISR
ncbi:MAG: hypothetical protein WC933_01450 [Candidatus Paceibacterota bacterium]|jgi:hypothetical protein